jgi:hypothetical protein
MTKTSRRFASRGDLLGLAGIECERLFAEHCLVCRNALEHRRCVLARRRGDVDGIDRSIGSESTNAVVYRACLATGGEFACPLDPSRRNGGECMPLLAEPPDLIGHGPGHAPRADDSPPHRIHGLILVRPVRRAD